MATPQEINELAEHLRTDHSLSRCDLLERFDRGHLERLKRTLERFLKIPF